MKHLIRFFMTFPVFFVFGLTGLARLWRFGGRFTIHGKDYEEISRAGVSLLRDLHDLQNGPGLEMDRPEWEATMKEVQEFLSENEK